MKRKFKIALLAGITAASLIAGVSAALSWFMSDVKMPDSFSVIGNSGSAYFYKGNGTEENPYIIRSNRHFYNLAWLQDIGMFNKQKVDENGDPVFEDGHPVIEQVYFKLDDSLKATGLNLNGMTLPPIGTEQYPFLGHFDGNNVIVSNFSVSNQFSDYGTYHPARVGNFSNSESGVKQPNIIGLFGVVGQFEEEGDYVYDSEVNTLSNFGANNFTVKTVTDSSLIGLAAGYVNSELSNVAVNNGSLNVAASGVTALDEENLTDKLSDYTVVGYCTDAYKADVSNSEGTVYGVDITGDEFAVNDDGDGAIGKGGTIKMTEMFNRITSIKNANNRVTQVTRKTVTYEPDGTTIHSSTNDASATNGFVNYHSANYESGNYSFGYRNSDTYNYLAGGHYENSYYIDDYYVHTGHRITTDNTHFLSTTSKVISNGLGIQNSDESNALVWNIIGGNTGKLTTTYEGNLYYLEVYNTTNLRITSTAGSGTTFTKAVSNGKTRYLYGDYYLGYDNGWKMIHLPTFDEGERPTTPNPPTEPDPGPTFNPPVDQHIDASSSDFLSNSYQITYTNNGTTYYLNNNNTTVNTITAGGNPVLPKGWRIASGSLTNNGSVVLSTTNNGGTAYYLAATSGNNGLQLVNNQNNATTFSVATTNGGAYRLSYNVESGGCGGGTTTYYLKFNNNTFTIATGSGGADLHIITTAQAVSDYNDQIDAAALAEYNRIRGLWSQYYSDLETLEERQAAWDAALEEYNAELELTYNLSFVEVTESDNVKGPDYYLDNSKTTHGMKYTNEDTTYFPLNVIEDGTQTQANFNKYYPRESNTGYVVSGSDYPSNFNSNETYSYARIRVSSYAISNISNSYSTSTKDFVSNNDTYKIYTLDSGYNYVKASDALYENYSANRDKLKEVLNKDNSNVYGLHFMDSVISMDRILTAKYVKLNTSSEPYSNYEMPVNSINFNLIEKGYINFFAGMYFNTGDGNDSFFSLHQVLRNKSTNQILDIKEIEEVLSDGIEAHSYVYKFTDGTYSKPFQYGDGGAKMTLALTPWTESLSETSVPTTYVDPTDNNTVKSCSYTSVFNAQRITNHYYHDGGGHSKGDIVNSAMTYNGSTTVDGATATTNKSIFYFEIPMNDGEFCLGSVEGGTGGYLFYLDIGANAKKLNQTCIAEHYYLKDEFTSYPKGVAVVVTSVNTNVSFSDGEGAVASIAPSYNSTLVVGRSGNDINITSGYDDNYIIGVYKNDGVTFNSGAPPPTGTAIDIVKQENETEIRRYQYFDFDVAKQETTRTIVTGTKISENSVVKSNTTHIEQYVNDVLKYDNEDPSLSDVTKVKFYNKDNGNAIPINTLVPPTAGTNTEIDIVNFEYQYSGSGRGDITFDLVYNRTGTATYYSVSGYNVNIPIDAGDTATITTSLGDSLPSAYTAAVVNVNGHYVIAITGVNVHV